MGGGGGRANVDRCSYVKENTDPELGLERIAGKAVIDYPVRAMTMPHATWKRITLFIDVSFQGLSESLAVGVGVSAGRFGEADRIGEAYANEVGFRPPTCCGRLERETVVRNGVVEGIVCAAECAEHSFSVFVFLEELVCGVHVCPFVS